MNERKRFKCFFFLQTVGDAISDMLLVEIILQTQGWSLENWLACYTDLPNRQMKVKVSTVSWETEFLHTIVCGLKTVRLIKILSEIC